MIGANESSRPRGDEITTITFDCYGTLIDWETGLLGALVPWLEGRGVSADRSTLLSLYAQYEPEEQGGAYRTYRAVLSGVMKRFAAHFNVSIHAAECELLADSIACWKPFPDTGDALLRLSSSRRLAVISNIDNELFALTRRHLPDVFSEVITAEEVGAYKPSHRNFLEAQRRLSCGRAEWLHAAESLFHDIQPCNQLGIRSAWINRRAGARGPGATRACDATPDWSLSSLSDLAAIMAP